MSYRFTGENNNDQSGISVSSAGDVDGDGKADLLIGAPGNSGLEGYKSGATYLINGADLAALDLADGTVDGVISLGSVNGAGTSYKIAGENPYDLSGTSVSSAGDVDGDGKDDLLIGAQRAQGGGASSGISYLINAADLAALDTAPGTGIETADGIIPLSQVAGIGTSYKFLGEFSGDWSGYSVSSAGDVDGDGKDDLLIGAPYNDVGGADAGRSYLINSADLAALDIADGTADGVIALSQVSVAGRSYKILGEASEDYSGYSVSSAGDVDGDGLDDLLVGAPFADQGGDDSGNSFLLNAADLVALDGADGTVDGVISLSEVADIGTSYKFVGKNAYDTTGVSVSSAGDVDGDGRDDLLIGAPDQHTGSTTADGAYLVNAADLAALDLADGMGDGVISVSHVAATGTSYEFVGQGTWDRAGYSVSSAGDVDGDGLDDLLIGAPYSNNWLYYSSHWLSIQVGDSYLVNAVDLAALDLADGAVDGRIEVSHIAATGSSYTFSGEGGADYAGSSVSSAGDVDGDGLDDVLIGAYSAYNVGNREPGISYLISSVDLARLDGLDGAVDGDISLRSVERLYEIPVINGLDGDRVTFADGDTSVFLDLGTNATVADTNVTGFAKATLSVTYTSGQQAEDRLLIDTSGAVTLSAGQTLNSIVSVRGVAIGKLTWGGTGGINEGLGFVLSAQADAMSLQTLLRAISYTNTAGDTPLAGERVFSVALTSGEGEDSLTGAVSVTVDVAAVNPPGFAVDDLFTGSELDTVLGNLLSGNPTTNDGPLPQGSGVTAINGDAAQVGTAVSLASGAIVTVSASGDMAYDPNGVFEYLAAGARANDSFTYELTGGDTATVTVTVVGADNRDVVIGTAAQDLISGGRLADTLDGGAGIHDLLDYRTSSAGVTIDLATNSATGGDATGDTISNFEWVFGSNAPDELTGDMQNNVLSGWGDDDVISGGDGRDLIFGGNGEDTLSGGADFDVLFGGGGTDTYLIDMATDEIEIIREGAWDRIELPDSMMRDLVLRRSGTSLVIEEQGTTGKVVIENHYAGEWVASLTTADRALSPRTSLEGNFSNNIIVGTSQAETLSVHLYNNVLIGGGGADVLISNKSRGSLTIESNTFKFNDVSDSPAGATPDIIRWFNIGHDIIDLYLIDANLGVVGDNAFVFLGEGPTAGAGTLAYTRVGSDALVEADVDGGGADFAILLEGYNEPVASDFIL